MSALVPWTSRLLVVLCIALALRCGAGVVLQRWLDRQNPPRFCLISGDAEGYWELAQNLAFRHDYSIYEPPRRVMRMPGFPLFLASCIRVVGPDNVLATRIALAGVGTLACGLVYWLGKELFDPGTGLIAAALAAVSPTFVGFSVLILSETFFAATLLASLIAFARLMKTDFTAGSRWRGIWRAAAAGIFVAIATYVRPTWLLAGPVFGLLYVVSASDRGVAAARGAVLLFVLALALAPWTYRNYVITGRFVPTTLWFGASLYDGLNPEATGDSNMTFFERERINATLSEYDTDQHYRRAAWKYLFDHPRRAAELAVAKEARFWSPWPNATQFRTPLFLAFNVVAAGFYLGIVVLAVVQLVTDIRGGSGFLSQRGWGILLTLGPVIYFAALHLLFVGSIRYRLPAEYAVLVMSAAGARGIWIRLSAGRNGLRPNGLI